MTPSTDLYELIAAMNTAERRHFTRFARAGYAEDQEIDFIELFSFICKTKAKSDEDLFSKKDSERFIENFPVQKAELPQRILNVMRSRKKVNGQRKSLPFLIRETMEDIAFLREKGMYAWVYRRLAEIKAEAEENDLHELLLEISGIERNLIRMQQPADSEAKITALHAQNAVLTKTIQNKYEMLRLKDKLFSLAVNHSNLTDAAIPDEITEIMQSPELTDIARCISFEASSNYHFCHLTYQHLLGNAYKAWEHSRALFLMWKERKGIQVLKPLEYANLLQNYLAMCNEVMRYDNFDWALKRLEVHRFNRVEEQANAQQNALFVRHQRHLNLCEWAAAKAVHGEYEQQKADFQLYLSDRRRIAFALSFSRMYMALGEWVEAASSAAEGVKHGKGKTTQGLVLQALIQEIIALFEAEDVVQVEARCRSILETDNPERALPDFERMLVQMLRKCVSNREKGRFRAEVLRLLAMGEHLAKDRETSLRIVMAWLRSKRDNCTLAEALQTFRKQPIHSGD